MADYNLENLCMLVVDDNHHMRKLVKNILHSLGVKEVVEAADGSDALKELKARPIDLLITDWIMEPLDGVELVRMIRTGSDSENPFIPIIMLTGHTEQNRVIEARDVGINEFLAKPISAKSVYSRVKSVIEDGRSFVRTSAFFGPDRRRRAMEYPGPDRRGAAED